MIKAIFLDYTGTITKERCDAVKSIVVLLMLIRKFWSNAPVYSDAKELFEKALEVSGLRANEVIHIGDSMSSDVKGVISSVQPSLFIV